MRRILHTSFPLVLPFVLLLLSQAAPAAPRAAIPGPDLFFEANRGQFPDDVSWAASRNDLSVRQDIELARDDLKSSSTFVTLVEQYFESIKLEKYCALA